MVFPQKYRSRLDHKTLDHKTLWGHVRLSRLVYFCQMKTLRVVVESM